MESHPSHLTPHVDDVARRLQERGVTAYTLQYTLCPTPKIFAALRAAGQNRAGRSDASGRTTWRAICLSQTNRPTVRPGARRGAATPDAATSERTVHIQRVIFMVIFKYNAISINLDFSQPFGM